MRATSPAIFASCRLDYPANSRFSTARYATCGEETIAHRVRLDRTLNNNRVQRQKPQCFSILTVESWPNQWRLAPMIHRQQMLSDVALLREKLRTS